jgi:hypothetical protein
MSDYSDGYEGAGEQYADAADGFQGDGLEGMDQGGTIGADPPQIDPWDREARQERITARLEGREPEPEAEPEFDYGEPPDEYDVAQADIASFQEYERTAKAAEVTAFNDDVLQAARKHGLEPPTPEELKGMFLAMRDTDMFSSEGVAHLMERLAHDEQRLEREHDERLLAIRHGQRDPVTGEFPSWQEQERAKDEWRRRWAKRNGFGGD